MKSNKELPIGSEITLARRSKRYFQRKYEVTGHEGRTKLILKDVYRGPGWDETLQKYVGVRTVLGWFRGQNYGYGEEMTIHVKEIAKWNIDKIVNHE